jgi:hypothetical protein
MKIDDHGHLFLGYRIQWDPSKIGGSSVGITMPLELRY